MAVTAVAVGTGRGSGGGHHRRFAAELAGVPQVHRRAVVADGVLGIRADDAGQLGPGTGVQNVEIPKVETVAGIGRVELTPQAAAAFLASGHAASCTAEDARGSPARTSRRSSSAPNSGAFARCPGDEQRTGPGRGRIRGTPGHPVPAGIHCTCTGWCAWGAWIVWGAKRAGAWWMRDRARGGSWLYTWGGRAPCRAPPRAPINVVLFGAPLEHRAPTAVARCFICTRARTFIHSRIAGTCGSSTPHSSSSTASTAAGSAGARSSKRGITRSSQRLRDPRRVRSRRAFAAAAIPAASGAGL